MTRAPWVLLLIGAALVVLGVLIQAFSIVAYMRGAGDAALDMHGANSLTVHLGQLAIVVGGIWAFWRNWAAVGGIVLFLVLGFAQLAFIGDTDESGDWVNGLHGALAIVLLVWALAYGQIAYRRLFASPRRSVVP